MKIYIKQWHKFPKITRFYNKKIAKQHRNFT